MTTPLAHAVPPFGPDPPHRVDCARFKVTRRRPAGGLKREAGDASVKRDHSGTAPATVSESSAASATVHCTGRRHGRRGYPPARESGDRPGSKGAGLTTGLPATGCDAEGVAAATSALCARNAARVLSSRLPMSSVTARPCVGEPSMQLRTLSLPAVACALAARALPQAQDVRRHRPRPGRRHRQPHRDQRQRRTDPGRSDRRRTDPPQPGALAAGPAARPRRHLAWPTRAARAS